MTHRATLANQAFNDKQIQNIDLSGEKIPTIRLNGARRVSHHVIATKLGVTPGFIAMALDGFRDQPGQENSVVVADGMIRYADGAAFEALSKRMQIPDDVETRFLAALDGGVA